MIGLLDKEQHGSKQDKHVVEFKPTFCSCVRKMKGVFLFSCVVTWAVTVYIESIIKNNNNDNNTFYLEAPFTHGHLTVQKDIIYII